MPKGTLFLRSFPCSDDVTRYFLQKYGDSSFQSCKDESEEVMEKVIRQMEGLVVSDAADNDDRAEAVQLLEQLNQPVSDEQVYH